MKKDFRVFSNVQCTEPGCTKKLKQNLIDRNPDADRCFKHFPFARRNRCQGKQSADSSQQFAVGNN